MSDYNLFPLEQALAEELSDAFVRESSSHLISKHWVVALSGGLDSKALLCACVELRDAGLIEHLRAIHVSHGLQTESEEWLKRCESDCKALQVPLQVARLKLSESHSSNIEAAARQGRYEVFEQSLVSNECLLLAHHQDDQLETLLFRLLRGCGVDGAAAMPKSRVLGKAVLLRPWLGQSRQSIAEYAAQKKLHYIDDPSNQCLDFSRNYLRHEIIPLLKQRWPACGQTLSRFSELAAEQSSLLKELAAADLKLAQAGDGLVAAQLMGLSQARLNNLLHFWGRKYAGIAPARIEVTELARQLPAAQTGAIRVNFASGSARSFQGKIYWVQNLPRSTFDKTGWLNWQQSITLDNGIEICVQQKTSASKDSQPLLRLPRDSEKVYLAPRRGGEKVRPHYRQHSNSVKKVFQELAVPPWLRERLPLVFYEDQLVAIPGVFVASEFLASDEESGLELNVKWPGTSA